MNFIWSVMWEIISTLASTSNIENMTGDVSCGHALCIHRYDRIFNAGYIGLVHLYCNGLKLALAVS